MVNMEGLTIGELADLYDKQTPEVHKWMLENSELWWGKKNPNEESLGFINLF